MAKSRVTTPPARRCTGLPVFGSIPGLSTFSVHWDSLSIHTTIESPEITSHPILPVGVRNETAPCLSVAQLCTPVGTPVVPAFACA